jgi:1,4-dihydroxy-2-naphthoyl-CoA hydrolase
MRVNNAAQLQGLRNMATLRPEITLDSLRERQRGCLPDLLGVEVVSLESGTLTGKLTIRPELLAPNGFLHAATVIGLADTCCGYACIAHLPEGAKNFTTVELKSNHVGTAREGVITAKATAVHLGRSTHVWDAIVTNGEGKTIALFRCTQMILY